jgi:hypothetical protein
MQTSELAMKNNVARYCDPRGNTKNSLTSRMPRTPALNEDKLPACRAAEEERQHDESELAEKEYRQSDHGEIRPMENKHRQHSGEQQTTPTRRPKT